MPTKPHLPGLTGLRALAAFWVLLFHLYPQIKLFFGSVGLVGDFIACGYLGVDLFFILSGFTIGYKYFEKFGKFSWIKYKKFLLKRFVHLYPLHITMLLLIAILVFAAPFFGITVNNPDDYTLPKFIAHVLMVSAWTFPAEMSWNYFAWFVSAIWLMYLLTPLFIRVASSAPRIMFIFCAVLTPIAAYLWPQDSKVAYALFRAIGGYGMGMALYRMFGTSFIKWLPDFLNSRFLQYWGELSYPLYITQFVTLMAIKKILPPETLMDKAAPIQIGYIGAELAVVLLFAVCCHHLFSQLNRL